MAMLNGMLEIAAAGRDGAGINLEAVDVAGLVEEAGEVLRPQAEDKGLELHVVIDESVPGSWSTDPTRLRQVLFNLGGNAVKYTARGSVELRAAAVADGGRQRLRLRVADTGPGDRRGRAGGDFRAVPARARRGFARPGGAWPRPRALPRDRRPPGRHA